jgi:hypothetical protein
MDNNAYSLFDVFQGQSIDKVQEDFCYKYGIDMADWEQKDLDDLEELFNYSFDLTYNLLNPSSDSEFEFNVGKIHISKKYLYSLMKYDLLITMWLYKKYGDIHKKISLNECLDKTDLDYSYIKKEMKIFCNTYLKELFDVSFGLDSLGKQEQYSIASTYTPFIRFMISNIKHCPIYKIYQPLSMDLNLYEKYSKDFPDIAHKAFFEKLYGFKMLSIISSSLSAKKSSSELLFKPYSTELILMIMEKLIKSPCVVCKLSLLELFLNNKDLDPIKWYIYFAGLLEFTTRLFEIWETIVFCKFPLSSDNVSKIELILKNNSFVDFRPKTLNQSQQKIYRLLRNEYYNTFRKNCPKNSVKFVFNKEYELQGRSGWRKPVMEIESFFLDIL